MIHISMLSILVIVISIKFDTFLRSGSLHKTYAKYFNSTEITDLLWDVGRRTKVFFYKI